MLLFQIVKENLISIYDSFPIFQSKPKVISATLLSRKVYQMKYKIRNKNSLFLRFYKEDFRYSCL